MPSADSRFPLGYEPASLPRELKRHYISASDADIAAMSQVVGIKKLDELYSHIDPSVVMAGPLPVPEELSYDDLQKHLIRLSLKNRAPKASFIGDGLPSYEVQPIVSFVCNIRNLTTAYTPYQPERSQGTLMTHWVYQSLMSQLTGFEAINSSLYDRSTALFEAICTSIRLGKKCDTALIPEALYPTDLEVVKTLAADTEINLVTLPLDAKTGLINLAAVEAEAVKLGERLACIVFPQVNSLGNLEDVDALTDLAHRLKTRAVAVIDPMLLGTGGLKAPVDFGSKGADLIVGEAQHLAIGPNFSGPGLGLFGIRLNDTVKNDIRQTPGRYVGKAFDLCGRECRVMVLSTREQHIRRDKATSNICSNQAFLATIAGASLLNRGESGVKASVASARSQAAAAAAALTALPGLSLAFPQAPFFNEFTLQLPVCVVEAIKAGAAEGLHIGVRVSPRVPGGDNLLKLSFSDLKADLPALVAFFSKLLGVNASGSGKLPEIPARYLRTGAVGLPEFSLQAIKDYYSQLGELNVSPDDACYPLGSCTMKYNPYVNDWAAGLPGFTQAHPQAPTSDVQGCLEVLHECQEWFKGITGLAGLTTQPVAGAQGELVGVKLFQAYHRDRGEKRDVILIPRSSHGTNFATAAMAGLAEKVVDGVKVGIVNLEANADGSVCMEDFEAKVAHYGRRICGIMVTNPNTSGVFEVGFKKMAERIHEIGGLVYMDGANMNAIAGWVDLGKLGVDAVHNNLHKTWTIPHGGGGPGDGIVAVSARLMPYLPGHQVVKHADGSFEAVKMPKSIGSFHRHFGNFAHKIRAYTYLLRLGREGVRQMSALSVLSARYCFQILRQHYPSLPAGATNAPRMHEFILTLEESDFLGLEKAGIPRANAIGRVGKLFLDFGFHAPTVAWPEQFGLMIEPTETYTKTELDRFCDAVIKILHVIRFEPQLLTGVPYFTPVDRIDDVAANRTLVLNERITALPPLNLNRVHPSELSKLSLDAIHERIRQAAAKAKAS